MRWRRTAYAAVNRVLARGNFVLERASKDFDARITSPRHRDLIFQRLADVMESWIATQKVFPVQHTFSMVDEIGAFYDDYLKAPFRDLHGGSRFNNALWLTIIAKAMQPTIVVDSGTYTGASAWALSRTLPGVPVISFDIDLSRLRRRSSGVKYVQSDWNRFDFSSHNLSRPLCYFDDHVDQVRRVLEAAERGLDTLIFDDDFTLGAFPAFAPDAHVLPKIEFVLDDALVDGDAIEWISGGRLRSWRVDRSYLEQAKAKMIVVDRLPDTSLITGIQQTPYRLLRVVAQKHTM